MNCPTSRSVSKLKAPRPGFTMVELLVVIVILALLMALLLPAIQGAIKTARNAAVSAEINQLAQALADFKNRYGDYPPSRMLLCEDGFWRAPGTSPASSTSDTDITNAALVQRSISFMRKFWPRVAVTATGPAIYTTAGGNWLDFNGNGTLDLPYILEGHECLVFFLGGIPTTGGVSGFAKNPSNPFLSSTAALGANRQPPLFEFDAGRLMLDPTAQSNPNRQLAQIPGYYDSFKTNRFYAYFSAYGGNAYDPNDVNFDQAGDTQTESDGNGVSPLTLSFLVTFPVGTGTGNIAVSTPPNPYTSTVTNPASGSVTFQKPQTFQIISAGADGAYGVGGQFVPSGSPALPPDPSFGSGTSVYNSTDTALRVSEKDNVSNFYNTKLD